MTYWSHLLSLLAEASARTSSSEACFSVQPLPDKRDGWIGCSSSCSAAFLLRVPDADSRQHAVSLPSLRVRHGVRVLVDDGVTRSEAVVSVLECLATDMATIELFVRCVGTAVTDSAPLSALGLATAVDRLLELFRDFAHATESELLGLWGELVLITHCTDGASMARYWRHSAASRFDFGTETERLDVKTTTSSLRHHELSFDQAMPPSGVAAAFASIMTERVSNGTSVRDLWSRALALAPAEHAKIDAACVQTLGRDWAQVQDVAFDLARALSTLQLFPVSSVPRIDGLPVGVLRARFVSDFSRGTAWHGPPPSADGPIAVALGCVGVRRRVIA